MATKNENTIAGMISNDHIKNATANQVIKKEESKRTERLYPLVTPELKQKALAKCATIGKDGISLNEAINQLLENWVNE